MDVVVRLLHKWSRSIGQGPLRLGWLKGLRVELLVVRFCDQKRNNIHNLNQYARLEVHDQTIREPKQKIIRKPKRAEINFSTVRVTLCDAV